MKVLIFTHEADIDGIGSLVLAKFAFEEFDYVLCKTHEINMEVLKKIEDKSIYNYDKVYLTDLCINDNLIDMITNDKILKDKFLVFDHHKSEIREKTKNSKFISIVVENDIGKCCGTSLFYEFLLKSKYIKENELLDKLVETTRQYDTWEWKNIYNNKYPNYLNILFNIIGNEEYLKNITRKIKNNEPIISNEEIILINDKLNSISNKIKKILKNIKIVNKPEGKFGIIFDIEYELRNDISDYIRDNDINIDIDYIMLEIKEKNSMSFRSIKSEFDVSNIAIMFGGKGHKNAASAVLNDELYKYISE